MGEEHSSGDRKALPALLPREPGLGRQVNHCGVPHSGGRITRSLLLPKPQGAKFFVCFPVEKLSHTGLRLHGYFWKG